MHAVSLLTKSSLQQDNGRLKADVSLRISAPLSCTAQFGELHLGMLLVSELTSVPSAETRRLCVAV